MELYVFILALVMFLYGCKCYLTYREILGSFLIAAAPLACLACEMFLYGVQRAGWISFFALLAICGLWLVVANWLTFRCGRCEDQSPTP
jgi:hypothetical protein